ncbi:flagellar motor protein MotD [Rhodanobacter sp. AS-Z3]|uniref:flagellar motor protein MotD n=1 Tax=Rhodanobacter sp. AS-Z3 TaxID=3031330 RepID=UPI0024794282|nr:flagellar motor protein MotD [Rhodanobacter sp. AS-Z3]WEN14589.1 flagellar motor protein MotD [Rhodanobacter sp. AS-Z3]
MRKHKHEEHLNHEAWAIPYADLMTLLLAFFVVMYAVSVVNEGKYRVMSNSLIQAFNGSSGSTAAPSPATPGKVNTSAAVSVKQTGAAVSPVALPIALRPPPVAGAGSRPGVGNDKLEQKNLQRIENQVRQALQPLIEQKMVVVRRKQDGLEIEIRTDILFPSGVAQLSTTANAVLSNLATILAPFPNPLRVEGFTDNVPINTLQFPSNWELSAARAASVARLFAASGVDPARLGIIGWGEVRPVTDNATVAGRNQNRRVIVVVMNDQTKPQREETDANDLHDIAAAPGPTPVTDNLPAALARPTLPPVVIARSRLPTTPSDIAVEAQSAEHSPAAVVETSRSIPRRAGPDR